MFGLIRVVTTTQTLKSVCFFSFIVIKGKTSAWRATVVNTYEPQLTVECKSVSNSIYYNILQRKVNMRSSHTEVLGVFILDVLN